VTGSTGKLAGTGPFSGRSVSEMGGDLRSGRTSALELAEQALEAAHTYGPALNCYTAIDDPGALQAARSADRELASGRDRGPLHGIPVGVKDIIAVAGLPAAMGSQHFANHTPTADAAVVGSLRRAGAVIIGKTHAHEFAFGPTGDRALTGPARNPHDRGRVTGGSSSGSAAAVAAGLLPLALGTDTAGSVRIPAALCGTVGLRPSSGTVSCEGVFPLSRTLDVVGPLAATAADTAAAWWALSGRPDHTGNLQPRWNPAWTEDPPGPSRPRWGLARGVLADRVTPGVRRTVQNAAAALGRMDIAVEEIEIPELD
jgi:aspartyl-tRNA(Asn)/glutamyl-tRNA(Gln) amidotransferase subunit A